MIGTSKVQEIKNRSKTSTLRFNIPKSIRVPLDISGGDQIEIERTNKGLKLSKADRKTHKSFCVFRSATTATVTYPKLYAEEFGIQVGDILQLETEGDCILVVKGE